MPACALIGDFSGGFPHLEGKELHRDIPLTTSKELKGVPLYRKHYPYRLGSTNLELYDVSVFLLRSCSQCLKLALERHYFILEFLYGETIILLRGVWSVRMRGGRRRGGGGVGM